MRLGAAEWLLGLWVVAALGVVAWWGVARGGRAVRRFVERGLVGSMAGAWSPGRRAVKVGLVVAALASGVVALARPQWDAEPVESVRLGRDVCFVIDVSRSMLAEDLAPNRLERAKLWVGDALGVVRGDRVALVAFAGTAVVKCPLTHDYGFFRRALDELSAESVARGGTLIGDALRTAGNEVFGLDEDGGDAEEARYRDVILITDGEDQESFPAEAAARLGELGVRLIAIGIGAEGEGRPIPITDERGRRDVVRYRGEVVLSKLDAETLRESAARTPGGRYFNVATGTIELDRVYRSLILEAERRETEARPRVRYGERFQVFLGLALGLLLVETLIRGRGRAA